MRAFIAFIVDNALLSVIAAIAVVAIGASSIPSLKITNLPTVEVPSLVVTLTLPGASPAEIESRVVFEIEDELQSLGDIDEFETDIFKNYAVIRIKFIYGVDINEKYLEVSSKLNKLQDELPDDLESSIEKQSPTDMLVPFVFAIAADSLTRAERLTWANRFKSELRGNEFLQKVEVVKSDREVTAWLDMDRMRQYDISVGQITEAIGSENRFLPVGTMDFGAQAVTIIPPGSSYEDLADVLATPLLTTTGKSVSLADIATVEETYKPDPVLYRVNGRPATLITAKTREDANVLVVREQLDQIAEKFRALLPAGAELHFAFNVEEGVRRNITGLLWNVAQGIAILCVVLLFSVGYRSTFAIGIMLPLSLTVSLVWLSMTDFGLQQMSIAGFIIALGLIVDNGIVVTENAYKLSHYQNFSNRDAAIEGTGSVISPLLSSTLTTALAFLPVYLLTSQTGLIMRSLAVTIWMCLAASLFVAVSATTLSVARFGTVNRLRLFPRLPDSNRLCRALNRLRRVPSPPSFLNAMIPFRDRVFTRVLEAAIKRWWALLAVVILLFGIAGWCTTQVQQIVFPPSDEPYFSINIEAAENSSESFMRGLTGQVEEILGEYPEITRVTTVQGGNFPRVFIGLLQVVQRRTDAALFVEVSFRDSVRLATLVDELNQRLHRLSTYAAINASPMLIGKDTDVDTTVTLSGATISELRDLGRQLDDRLWEIPDVLSVVNSAKADYHSISVKRDALKAQALKVPKAAIDPVLMLFSHGLKIEEFRNQAGEEFDIVLRARARPGSPLEVFDRLTVTTQQGDILPLSQVAGYEFVESQYDISHENFRPKLDIDLYALPGSDVKEFRRRVGEAVAGFELPSQVSVSYESEQDRTHEAFGGIGKYTLWVAVAIFSIFVLQFNSLVQPLIVFAAVPLCSIGAFFTLYLTGQPLSFAAFLGLTSLMGIVVNNSILLVDRANIVGRENPQASTMEVAIEAARNRFMPIVLTSATTIMGLAPLAFGESVIFKALALVVMGGLFGSTFLTLLCVPTLYSHFSPANGVDRLAITGDLVKEH